MAQEPITPGSADYTSLVQLHWESVYRLMMRLSGNVHDAEELTQEAFLRALSKMDQFRPGTNMRGWLLRIATNAFLTVKRRSRSTSLGDAADELADRGKTAGVTMQESELSALLKQAILQLNATQRAVFVLRTTEELSFGEISKVINTSETTVRWHMSQARQQLVKLLEGKL